MCALRTVGYFLVYALPTARATSSGANSNPTSAEYRSKPDDLFLTEIDYVAKATTISEGHSVAPLVLGQDRVPPTNQLSSIDVGPDGWLSVPSKLTLLESVNATLRPDEFGLDFSGWETDARRRCVRPEVFDSNRFLRPREC